MTDPPRFPQWRDLTAVNFVTEAFLVGCSPHLGLFLEFAKEPAKDLALFLIVPEAFDIAQAIFQPKKGRRTKPGRHGRKRPGTPGMPNADDIIGGKVRAVLNPYDAFKLTPFRYVFPLYNLYEGVNFGVAVVEGLIDVVYEGTLGALLMRPNYCRDFGRLYRFGPDYAVTGTGDDITISPALLNVNFDTSQWAARYNYGSYWIGVQMRARCNEFGTEGTCSACFVDLDNNLLTTGVSRELTKSGWDTLTVGDEFESGQWVKWRLTGDTSFVDTYERMVLAFAYDSFG